MSKLTLLGAAMALVLTGACSSDDEDTSEVRGGAFRITASGEELAFSGYDFPPAPGQGVFLADGWEVRFEKALVVIDHVHLSESPDIVPSDQSQMGNEVAELDGGPFVVDLSADGPEAVPGKESGDKAWPLGVLSKRSDGRAFDPTERYALSYSFVSATEGATTHGLEASDSDYVRMVHNGWTHLLIGTATRQQPVAECTTTSEFDYASLPTEVRFEFGFTTAVEMANCQNPELTGAPISDAEESQRGVQARAGETVDVQLTLHTDHLFWNTLAHGATPQFNHFAALAKEVDGQYVVTLEDLEGAALVGPAEDDSGHDLGWMSCVDASEYVLPSQPIFTFDAEGQDVDDVHDFVLASASTMGHLNQNGLCYIEGFEHSHDDDHHDHGGHGGEEHHDHGGHGGDEHHDHHDHGGAGGHHG